MNEQYNEWEKDSPRWRTELENKLTEHGGTDVVTHYKAVALAFPSSTLHPLMFDYPRIDESALRAWASARGLEVQTAPEMERGDDSASPPIRFTKT